MNNEQIKEKLEKHVMGLNGEEGGERADFSHQDLRGVNLRGVNLTRANLASADLRDADLRDADLRDADLRDADLTCADLRDADLTEAILTGADLRGAKGLLNPKEWMNNHFKKDKKGYIVYKKTGKTQYTILDHWKIKRGAVLEEECNYNRTTLCGCGVNFGTLKWCQNNYKEADLWKCRIEFEDLINVCVPYNTDGRARCARLVLISKVKGENNVQHKGR